MLEALCNQAPRRTLHLGKQEVGVMIYLVAQFLLPELGQLDVDDSVQQVLDSWLSGTWRPLERAGRQRLAHQLETRIQDASGRALKSRAFLDQMLDER